MWFGLLFEIKFDTSFIGTLYSLAFLSGYHNNPIMRKNLTPRYIVIALVLAWAVFSDNPQAMEKVNTFFEHFAALPKWFTNLWILVVASIFGIKGTQIFRNGSNKK